MAFSCHFPPGRPAVYSSSCLVATVSRGGRGRRSDIGLDWAPRAAIAGLLAGSGAAVKAWKSRVAQKGQQTPGQNTATTVSMVSCMTVKELRSELSEHGLETSGFRAQLVQRLEIAMTNHNQINGCLSADDGVEHRGSGGSPRSVNFFLARPCVDFGGIDMTGPAAEWLLGQRGNVDIRSFDRQYISPEQKHLVSQIYDGTSCCYAAPASERKTFCYLLPLLQRLTEKTCADPRPGLRMLILVSTDTAHRRTTTLVRSLLGLENEDTAALMQTMGVVVATPKQIINSLKTPATAHQWSAALGEVDMVVLDDVFVHVTATTNRRMVKADPGFRVLEIISTQAASNNRGCCWQLVAVSTKMNTKTRKKLTEFCGFALERLGEVVSEPNALRSQLPMWEGDLFALVRLLESDPKWYHEKECSEMIDALGKKGQWQQALSILDMMPRVGVAPNQWTYTAAINACGECARWRLSIGLLLAMRERDVAATVMAYTAVVSACAKTKEWQAALCVVAVMQNLDVTPNYITYTAAISACELQWQHALCLLKSTLAPDSVAPYNAAINACATGAQLQQALDIIAEIHQATLIPNEITYSSAIKACYVHKSVPTEAKHFSAIGASSMNEEWQHALDLLSVMRSADLVPNFITCCATIAACSNSGPWEVILELLVFMKRINLVLDAENYFFGICACDTGGRWQDAFMFLDEMQHARVQATIYHYAFAISACSTAGEWQHALGLLAVTPSPNSVAFNSAIGACRWQVALGVLAWMKEVSIVPDDSCYRSVMDAMMKERPGGIRKPDPSDELLHSSILGLKA